MVAVPMDEFAIGRILSEMAEGGRLQLGLSSE